MAASTESHAVQHPAMLINAGVAAYIKPLLRARSIQVPPLDK